MSITIKKNPKIFQPLSDNYLQFTHENGSGVPLQKSQDNKVLISSNGATTSAQSGAYGYFLPSGKVYFEVKCWNGFPSSITTQTGVTGTSTHDYSTILLFSLLDNNGNRVHDLWYWNHGHIYESDTSGTNTVQKVNNFNYKYSTNDVVSYCIDFDNHTINIALNNTFISGYPLGTTIMDMSLQNYSYVMFGLYNYGDLSKRCYELISKKTSFAYSPPNGFINEARYKQY